MSRNADPKPARVVAAAALFVMSGLLVLAQALAVQAGAGWPIPRALVGSGLRVLIAVVLAWGLFRGALWAWRGSVLVGGFWFLQGVLMMLIMFGTPPSLRALYMWPLAPLAWAFIALSTALVLLLTPKSRASFA